MNELTNRIWFCSGYFFFFFRVNRHFEDWQMTLLVAQFFLTSSPDTNFCYKLGRGERLGGRATQYRSLAVEARHQHRSSFALKNSTRLLAKAPDV